MTNIIGSVRSITNSGIQAARGMSLTFLPARRIARCGPDKIAGVHIPDRNDSVVWRGDFGIGKYGGDSAFVGFGNFHFSLSGSQVSLRFIDLCHGSQTLRLLCFDGGER